MTDQNDENKLEEGEQGFNDAELADIMNEIENLEQEFVGDLEGMTQDENQSAPETISEENAEEVKMEEQSATETASEVSTDAGAITEGQAAIDAAMEESASAEEMSDEAANAALAAMMEPGSGEDLIVEPVAEESSEPVAEEMSDEAAAAALASMMEPGSGEDLIVEPVAEESPESIIEETAAPVAEEISTEPVAEEVIAEPVAEEVIAEPVAEEVIAEPVAEEVVAEPVAEEVAPEPVAEEKDQPEVLEGLNMTADEISKSLGIDTVDSFSEEEELSLTDEEKGRKTDLQMKIDDEVENLIDQYNGDGEDNTPTPQSEETMDNVTALKPASSSNASGKTSMDFSVSGEMELNLNFNISGKSVSLAISEGQGLEITLEGGMKFIVPLDEATAIKKAS